MPADSAFFRQSGCFVVESQAEPWNSVLRRWRETSAARARSTSVTQGRLGLGVRDGQGAQPSKDFTELNARYVAAIDWP